MTCDVLPHQQCIVSHIFAWDFEHAFVTENYAIIIDFLELGMASYSQFRQEWI